MKVPFLKNSLITAMEHMDPFLKFYHTCYWELFVICWNAVNGTPKRQHPAMSYDAPAPLKEYMMSGRLKGL